MPDNTTLSGSPDRARINLDQPFEVQYWKTRFGVTVERLKEAVALVGNSAKAVERQLAIGKGAPINADE
jgi:hypothetical protein